MINWQNFITTGQKLIDAHHECKLTADDLDFIQDTVRPLTGVNSIAGWALLLCNKPGGHTVRHGADCFARMLGFEDSYALTHWAHANPDLWGNEDGALMFWPIGFYAFGFDEAGECTLQHVGLWLTLVGNRIRKEVVES